MQLLTSLKIDVTKIDKSRLYKGAKGTYLDLTVSIDTDEAEDWKQVSAWENQTKEERESKAERNFLGNGKVFWTGQGAEQKQALSNDEKEDLPF